MTGVAYLADTGNDTIDLVGEPAIKTFFSGFTSAAEKRNASPYPISTGTDFHKTYVPPPVVKKSPPPKPASAKKVVKEVVPKHKKMTPIKAYSRIKDSHQSQTVIMGTPEISSDEETET